MAGISEGPPDGRRQRLGNPSGLRKQPSGQLMGAVALVAAGIVRTRAGKHFPGVGPGAPAARRVFHGALLRRVVTCPKTHW